MKEHDRKVHLINTKCFRIFGLLYFCISLFFSFEANLAWWRYEKHDMKVHLINTLSVFVVSNVYIFFFSFEGNVAWFGSERT